MVDLETRIKDHGLRITDTRRFVLKAFLQVDKALTISDIRDYMGADTDRVTLYRTLNSFEEAGLIHKIPDEQHSVKYALCPSSCQPHDHVHQHAHFTCRICGSTQCLDSTRIPRVDSPSGYRVESAEWVLTGICPNCL